MGAEFGEAVKREGEAGSKRRRYGLEELNAGRGRDGGWIEMMIWT